jgi:hypothetical protein
LIIVKVKKTFLYNLQLLYISILVTQISKSNSYEKTYTFSGGDAGFRAGICSTNGPSGSV